MFKCDDCQHPAESHMMATLAEAGAPTEEIQKARALGISWVTIFAVLMANIGPGIAAALKALIDAFLAKPPQSK
jgi:hypothetical protein